MRKLKKLVLQQFTVLGTGEMQKMTGGTSSESYHYFLRCDQDSEEGIDVSDCDVSTINSYCGVNNFNSFCIDAYY